MKSKTNSGSESIHRRTVLKAVAAGPGAAIIPASGEAAAGQSTEKTPGDGERRLVSELGERSPVGMVASIQSFSDGTVKLANRAPI